MRIGFALFFGMLALIFLGYLGKYSLDQAEINAEQKKQIAALQQQIESLESELKRAAQRYSGCEDNLDRQEKDLIRLTAELNQIKNNPASAGPSKDVPVDNPSAGKSLTGSAGSLAGSIAAIIQLADLNPLFFAGLLLLAFLVFVGILLTLRWYLK